MNILVADSGSTKTDWCVCQQGKILQHISTPGINPVHLEQDEIAAIVNEMVCQLTDAASIGNIRFYGAGCGSPEMTTPVRLALQSAFPHCPATGVCIDSDLTGAALALCQGEAGIACILGTGSNSCQFDGQRIVANTPSLGYILGDEGSGASLGRILIGNWQKGLLPKELDDAFSEEYNLTRADLIERIYRRPLANRFLASFAPFLSKHRSEPAIHALLVEEFTRFFRRNVLVYDTSLPVHFVGSIAYHFNKELTEAATSLNLTIGRTLKTPMEGLAAYTVHIPT